MARLIERGQSAETVRKYIAQIAPILKLAKLMLTIMGGVAEFEREIMLERQREGIAKAKAEGRYKGRKPTARAKASEVQKMLSGGATVAQVVKALGISRASVYRLHHDQ